MDTIANTGGARSAILWPWIHLSFQKRVSAPLPTSDTIAMEKEAWALTNFNGENSPRSTRIGLLKPLSPHDPHPNCPSQVLKIRKFPAHQSSFGRQINGHDQIHQYGCGNDSASFSNTRVFYGGKKIELWIVNLTSWVFFFPAHLLIHSISSSLQSAQR